jgi:hypothetical protein
MSSFDDRLWSELARDHGERLASAGRRVRPARGCPGRRVVAAGAAVVIAASVALTLAATVSPPRPAYAVIVNRDGSVTLRLSALAAASAANERLARLGIRARVVFRERGCVAGRPARLAPGSERAAERQRADAILLAEGAVLESLARVAKQRPAGLAVHIRPDAIPARDTVVLAVRRLNGGRGATASHAIGMTAGLFRDPAPRCLPLR